MHASVMAYGRTWLPDVVGGADVLEVGSLDVNGSLRGLCASARSYKGVDIRPGPGVDTVMDGADVGRLGTFDVVICTETLEHARDWKAVFTAAAGAVRVGGYLLVTTRSPGFPLHGYPSDHWRFDTRIIGEALRACGFEVLSLKSDPEQPGVLAFARKTHASIGLLPDASPV